MSWQSRPHWGKKRPELHAIIKANWNEKSVLETVAHELSFRQKKASIELYCKVVQRIAELSKPDSAPEADDYALPDEEKGFLEYLGYCVSKGLTEARRRALLDTIYEQELPAEAAKKCGQPRSATRRLLIVESLNENLKRARRRTSNIPKAWSKSWKSDLLYFQEKYF